MDVKLINAEKEFNCISCGRKIERHMLGYSIKINESINFTLCGDCGQHLKDGMDNVYIEYSFKEYKD